MKIDKRYVRKLEQRLYRCMMRLDKRDWDANMALWFVDYVEAMDPDERADHDHLMQFDQLFDGKNESLKSPPKK